MDVPVETTDGIRGDTVVSGEASKESHYGRSRREGGEGDLAEISYRGRLTRSRVRQSTDLRMGDQVWLQELQRLMPYQIGGQLLNWSVLAHLRQPLG